MYASPLERCMQTAEAVAAGRGLDVVEAPELLEVGLRDVDGTFDGPARPDEAVDARPAVAAVRSASPTARRLTEVQQRAVAFLDGSRERHPKRIVAACAHADVIRLALAHYAGVHVDLFQRLIVSPASVSADPARRPDPADRSDERHRFAGGPRARRADPGRRRRTGARAAARWEDRAMDIELDPVDRITADASVRPASGRSSSRGARTNRS